MRKTSQLLKVYRTTPRRQVEKVKKDRFQEADFLPRARTKSFNWHVFVSSETSFTVSHFFSTNHRRQFYPEVRVKWSFCKV